MPNRENKDPNDCHHNFHHDPDLEKLANRLAKNIARNTFIPETLDDIRDYLETERVVLYSNPI